MFGRRYNSTTNLSLNPGSGDLNKLYIKFLPRQLRNRDKLLEICSKYGKVVHIKTTKDVPFGFVSFATSDGFEKAKNQLPIDHGLTVGLAHSKSNNEPQQQAQPQSLQAQSTSQQQAQSTSEQQAQQQFQQQALQAQSTSQQQAQQQFQQQALQAQSTSQQQAQQQFQQQALQAQSTSEQQAQQQFQQQALQAQSTSEQQAQQQFQQQALQAQSTSQQQAQQQFQQQAQPQQQPQLITGYCVVCYQLASFTCARCNDWYCSPNCQKIDWQKHRYICSAMPSLRLQYIKPNSVNSNVMPCSGQNIQQVPPINDYSLKIRPNFPQIGQNVQYQLPKPSNPLNILPHDGQNIQSQLPSASKHPITAHVQQKQLQQNSNNINQSKQQPNSSSKAESSSANKIQSSNANKSDESSLTTSLLDLIENTSTISNIAKPSTNLGANSKPQISDVTNTSSSSSTTISSNNTKPLIDLNSNSTSQAPNATSLQPSSSGIIVPKSPYINALIENNKEICFILNHPLLSAPKLPANGSSVVFPGVIPYKTNLVFVRSVEGNADREYLTSLNKMSNATSKNPLKELPKVGDIVATDFEGCGQYRVIVLESSNENMVSVLYVDVGAVTEKKLKELNYVPDDLKGLPRQTVPVYLKGIPSGMKSNEKILDYLEDFIDNVRQKLMIRYEKSDNNCILDAELIDKNNESINEKILELTK